MARQTINPTPAISKENELQEVFTKWPPNNDRWLVAGAPRWLKSASAPIERTKYIPNLGPSFTPDAVFQGREKDHIVELKHASKGEPLALAQVLYYARMLKTDPAVRSAYGRDVQIYPVMVTQQSFWLRAALAELFENCAPTIQLLEFDTFKFEDKKIIWLGDPFARWEKAEDPPQQLKAEFHGPRHWYHVPDEETWIGMPHECTRREPSFVEEHVVASRLSAGAGFIAWEGSYKDSAYKYELLT